jgi:hypothetical protein
MDEGEDEGEEREKLRTALVGRIVKYYLAEGKGLVAIQLGVDGRIELEMCGNKPREVMRSHALARGWKIRDLRPRKGESIVVTPRGTIRGLFTLDDMEEALAAAKADGEGHD